MGTELEPLDPALREYLDAFIEETAVSEARTDAALAGVMQRIDTPTAGSSGRAGPLVKIGIAVVAAGVAGALLWPRANETAPAAAATGIERSDESVPVQEPIPAISSAPPDDRRAAETPSDPTDLDDADPNEGRGERVRAAGKRRPQAEPAAREAVADGDDLAAELELLRSARSALRSGKPARARTLLLEHARRYPSSSFAEERDATLVRSLCTSDDVAAAKAAAARFEATYPSSPFRPGLLEACESSTPR